MTHPRIVTFLQSFPALKAKVNHNPRNLVWMAHESIEVEKLAVDVFNADQDLKTLLATASSKAITPVPTGFKGVLADYRSEWEDKIGVVISDVISKVLKELKEASDPVSDNTGSEPDRPSFDARFENAAELIEDILWLSDAHAQEDSDLGDEQRKALQAWDWFRDTVGLDLKAVAARWRRIQPVFVPDHVANAHGYTEPGSLYELLDQAVRAYVFGASTAAIAMCRALTELILTRHYDCEGDELKSIIIFAESRYKYAWMKKHKLDEKRKLANQVLHQYRHATNESVLGWLATLKELIEKAPIKSI